MFIVALKPINVLINGFLKFDPRMGQLWLSLHEMQWKSYIVAGEALRTARVFLLFQGSRHNCHFVLAQTERLTVANFRSYAYGLCLTLKPVSELSVTGHEWINRTSNHNSACSMRHRITHVIAMTIINFNPTKHAHAAPMNFMPIVLVHLIDISASPILCICFFRYERL